MQDFSFAALSRVRLKSETGDEERAVSGGMRIEKRTRSIRECAHKEALVFITEGIYSLKME